MTLLARRFEQVRTTLAADTRPSQSIKVVALGHTHLAAAPVPLTRGGVTPVVLNSGAWQRTATPFQIEEVMQDRGWSEGDVLRQLRPEDLPACYGVIWIEPYSCRSEATRAVLAFGWEMGHVAARCCRHGNRVRRRRPCGLRPGTRLVPHRVETQTGTCVTPRTARRRGKTSLRGNRLPALGVDPSHPRLGRPSARRFSD